MEKLQLSLVGFQSISFESFASILKRKYASKTLIMGP